MALLSVGRDLLASAAGVVEAGADAAASQEWVGSCLVPASRTATAISGETLPTLPPSRPPRVTAGEWWDKSQRLQRQPSHAWNIFLPFLPKNLFLISCSFFFPPLQRPLAKKQACNCASPSAQPAQASLGDVWNLVPAFTP